jgi:hypothetical protein
MTLLVGLPKSSGEQVRSIPQLAIISPSVLHADISPGGWTIGLLMAAVQRHSLTPINMIDRSINQSVQSQVKPSCLQFSEEGSQGVQTDAKYSRLQILTKECSVWWCNGVHISGVSLWLVQIHHNLPQAVSIKISWTYLILTTYLQIMSQGLFWTKVWISAHFSGVVLGT